MVPLASGKILEIGVGSGLNLPFYRTTQVQQLVALDPSEEIWDLAQERIHHLKLNVDFVKGGAENIPLGTHSMDTIVMTYTLCTVPDYKSAVAEFRRVLKSNGTLIFCEHGLAPDPSVQRWQNTLNPVWKHLGVGCHLNRNIPAIIKIGGFTFVKMESRYIPAFKPASFNYWGLAKP